MANHQRFYKDIMALNNEVSGSCKLNVIRLPDGTTKKVLIDCGLFQEREYYDFNTSLPFNAESIDHVIVTHGHMDHIGRIPLLFKNGYRGNVYTSYDTASIMRVALYDNLSIMNANAKFTHTRPLYSEADVDLTLRSIKCIPFQKTVKIDDNIKLDFFENGHLPGAAIILMRLACHSRGKSNYQKDINVLYSGDYKAKNMFFDVYPIPNWVYKLPLTIVQESTYAYMDSSEIECVFEKNILKAIAEGKEIVIPVLSLGRSQEVLYVLRKLQDEGKLDKNIPIYYAGNLGINYNKMYAEGILEIKNECRDYFPKNFIFVSNSAIKDSIISSGTCKILLTTSGMGTYGPAQFFLPIFTERENCLIHFTSYLAEDSKGRELLETKEGDVIDWFGLKVTKRATVITTSEFSSHAKKDELLSFLKNFENIKLVLIDHGSLESKKIYSQEVLKEGIAENVAILGRDYFYRIGGCGLIKSCTTKW